MATKQDLPATDSAAVLHDLIGDDATAVFESDPKFIDGTPAEDSTSENLQVRKDRGDFQNLPDMKAAPRSKALDEDDEDEVDDEDADDDDDDDDYEDVETEDEEDDDEDEDDDEEDDDDDDDEDDDEDDEDEDDE
jgi:hypothetical protein